MAAVASRRAGWRAITEPEEIVQWLGEADLESGEGGTVVLSWLNTPEQTVARGTVTAFDPPRALEFDTDLDRRGYTSQGTAQRCQPLWPEPEVCPTASLFSLDESGLGQDAQVMADSWLRQAEWFREVAHAGLTIRVGREKAEQPQAGRVRDHPYRGSQSLRLLLIQRGAQNRRAAIVVDLLDELHDRHIDTGRCECQDIDSRRYVRRRKVNGPDCPPECPPDCCPPDCC